MDRQKGILYLLYEKVTQDSMWNEESSLSVSHTDNLSFVKLEVM